MVTPPGATRGWHSGFGPAAKRRREKLRVPRGSTELQLTEGEMVGQGLIPVTLTAGIGSIMIRHFFSWLTYLERQFFSQLCYQRASFDVDTPATDSGA